MGIRKFHLGPISLTSSLTETFEMRVDIPPTINNIAITVMKGIKYVLALAYALATLVFAT